MTERELQDAVIECARLFGWRVAHFRPAMTKHGWRTPVQGDGKGFPDLILLRDGDMIAVELKADKGKLSDEQREWLDAFDRICDTFVWRPDHWASGTIEMELRPGFRHRVVA